VDALEHEPERARAAAGDLQVQGGLERLGPDGGGRVVQRPDQQRPRRVVGRPREPLAGGGDHGLQPAAADVLVPGPEPGVGGGQRVGGRQLGQGRERRVPDGRVVVEQQRPEPAGGPRVVQAASARATSVRADASRSRLSCNNSPSARSSPRTASPRAPRKQVSSARLAVAWSSGS
jgi:hypothetical protein